jgi:hypothetical protein
MKCRIPSGDEEEKGHLVNRSKRRRRRREEGAQTEGGGLGEGKSHPPLALPRHIQQSHLLQALPLCSSFLCLSRPPLRLMLNIMEYSSSAHEDQTTRADLAFSCIYQSSIESAVSYDLRFSGRPYCLPP